MRSTSHFFRRAIQVATVTGLSSAINASFGGIEGALGAQCENLSGNHYNHSDMALMGVKGGAIYGAAASFLVSLLYLRGARLSERNWTASICFLFAAGQFLFNGLIGHAVSHPPEVALNDTLFLFFGASLILSTPAACLIPIGLLLTPTMNALRWVFQEQEAEQGPAQEAAHLLPRSP